jgi:hypothetical protein
MATRAKFRVDSVQITTQPVYDRLSRETKSTEVATVILHPVTGGSKENEEFYAATPGGEIRLDVLNMSAAVMFKQGVQVYVDFSPALP